MHWGELDQRCEGRYFSRLRSRGVIQTNPDLIKVVGNSAVVAAGEHSGEHHTQQKILRML